MELVECFPELTAAFEDLLHMHENLDSATISTLQCFVVLSAILISDIVEVNEARKELFTEA